MKLDSINAGKMALGITIFLPLIFANYLFVGPWLTARLPEWLTWLNGSVIFLGTWAAGYLLSWTRVRLSPTHNILAAVLASGTFGVVMAAHHLTTILLVVVTAIPAWAGSMMAVDKK